MNPVKRHSLHTKGVVVVAGLFGSGTTYYTNYLNTIDGFFAQHEHIYPYDRQTWNEDFGAIPKMVPRPGQTHEVSGFAMPYEADQLLVRDPRLWIPSVKRLEAIFQKFTLHHLGFTPRDNFGYSLAWYRWNARALETATTTITIEEVPSLPLPDNSHDPVKEPVTTEDFAPEALTMMGDMGYLL